MKRIDKLLAVMTVGEKIGQLNMVAAGYAVTRQVLASGAKDIRAGKGASPNCRDNAPWPALL
jgi:beta-glucosidase